MADRRPSLSDVFAIHRTAALSEPEKVLWTLYRSYDRGDGAWPGDETLQTHMGSPGRPKSLRAVRTYRSALIEKGYLVRELRGPNPAVFRAIVPSAAECCPPSAADPCPSPRAQARQDSAAVRRQDSAALYQYRQERAAQEGQESAAVDEARQDAASQEGLERHEERQLDRQDSAVTPTPPIEEELREYGEVAVSEESGSERVGHASVGDGVVRFAKKHAGAAAMLGQLTHPGGKLGTAATLRTCFLYVNGEGIPDPSVQGLPLEERIDLVGRAIVEGISKGWREWSPRALAGFVRRLRETPPPTLPGGEPRLNAAEEAEREATRRETARARTSSNRTFAEHQARVTADVQAMDDAARWFEKQDAETKARVGLLTKTELADVHEFYGEVNEAPDWLKRPALRAVVERLRAEREGEAVGSAEHDNSSLSDTTDTR